MNRSYTRIDDTPIESRDPLLKHALIQPGTVHRFDCWIANTRSELDALTDKLFASDRQSAIEDNEVRGLSVDLSTFVQLAIDDQRQLSAADAFAKLKAQLFSDWAEVVQITPKEIRVSETGAVLRLYQVELKVLSGPLDGQTVWGLLENPNDPTELFIRLGQNPAGSNLSSDLSDRASMQSPRLKLAEPQQVSISTRNGVKALTIGSTTTSDVFLLLGLADRQSKTDSDFGSTETWFYKRGKDPHYLLSDTRISFRNGKVSHVSQ